MRAGKVLYACFAGGDIGPKPELTHDRLEEARIQSITLAIESSMRFPRTEVDLMAAVGDEVVVGRRPGSTTGPDARGMPSGFFGECDCTLSGGVAPRLSETAAGLRKAKLLDEGPRGMEHRPFRAGSGDSVVATAPLAR
jgi:hypothetical protein